MKHYFLDTEFNGYNGALLSLGVACDDGRGLYLVVPEHKLPIIQPLPWIAENIVPLLYLDVPGVKTQVTPTSNWGRLLSEFVYGTSDNPVQILTDWPSDLADLCQLLMTGPGTAHRMPPVTHFTILRHLDVYPTSLEGVIQHHALCDALALQEWCRTHDRNCLL